jgi:hypothetical protein
MLPWALPVPVGNLGMETCMSILLLRQAEGGMGVVFGERDSWYIAFDAVRENEKNIPV